MDISVINVKKKYDDLYKEFLIYSQNTSFPLRNILNIHYGKETTVSTFSFSRKKKIQYIYDSYLSEEAKKQLEYDYNNLYYHLKVIRDSDRKIIIIPPLAFFVNMNKPISFYLKLLYNDNINPLDVKTQYGSVNSRSQGGKNCLYRSMCLNKRYVSSARLVIVPHQSLLPHECILPLSIYKALNCPKHVLCHRYPTLDIRSMTYHRVIKVWQYPTLAISTAIVFGNNADFDGDCMHVIPATSIISQAELLTLCHPKNNMIVQNQLRIHFDHDEIETIYSKFGLTKTQIHQFLYEIAYEKSNKFAYNIFCNLKRYCEWIWNFEQVSTITYNDFLEIVQKGKDAKYDNFIENIFPHHISSNNGIKKLIDSEASRLSVNHVWQMFGYINEDAKDKGGFLKGMTKNNFIQMAQLSRLAMIKDVAYHGYSQIKLTHCTKSIILGYDQRLYTTDGLLVGLNINDLC